MSAALGQEIHLVSITVHISRIIGNDSSDALIEVNIHCPCGLYYQWYDAINCRMNIQQHEPTDDLSRSVCRYSILVYGMSLCQFDGLIAIIPATAVPIHANSNGIQNWSFCA